MAFKIDDYNQLTEKVNTRTKSFLYVSVFLGIIAFVFTVWMVIGIPALDTKGVDTLGTTDGWFGIDVGLHDEAFFAWTRPHISIIFAENSPTYDFIPYFEVTDPENGTTLRSASIVLLCFDFLALSILVCAMSIERTYLLKSNKGLFFTLCGMTCVVFVVIVSALFMRYGKFFGMFFNIETNKNMVNDMENFFTNIANGESMNKYLDAEYTKFGMACVSVLTALGGMFAVGTFFGLKNLHKMIKPNNQ